LPLALLRSERCSDVQYCMGVTQLLCGTTGSAPFHWPSSLALAVVTIGIVLMGKLIARRTGVRILGLRQRFLVPSLIVVLTSLVVWSDESHSWSPSLREFLVAVVFVLNLPAWRCVGLLSPLARYRGLQVAWAF